MFLKIEYIKILSQGRTKKVVYCPSPPSNQFKERAQIGKKAFQREREIGLLPPERLTSSFYSASENGKSTSSRDEFDIFFVSSGSSISLKKKPSMGIFSLGVHKKAEYILPLNEIFHGSL